MDAQAVKGRMMLKWLAAIVSVIWISVTFYQEFLDVDPDQFGFRSPEVAAQMKACNGTFQQRYDCKEAIIIAKGDDSFLLWVEKALLILAPPLIVVFLLNRGGRSKRPGSIHNHMVHRPPSVRNRRTR
jgi:hypothetical protein